MTRREPPFLVTIARGKIVIAATTLQCAECRQIIFVGFYEIATTTYQPSALPMGHSAVFLECLLGMFDGKHGVASSYIGQSADFVVILGIFNQYVKLMLKLLLLGHLPSTEKVWLEVAVTKPRVSTKMDL